MTAPEHQVPAAIYVAFAGDHIRKWSRESFEGSLVFRAAQPGEDALRDAAERFIADYDDGDRADAGNGPLMELHVADFRAALAATPAAPPAISDAWIAERWPDQDPAEVRRRFEALIRKLGETPWRGMPRDPETMQPVLAWAALQPAARIELLTAALAAMPDHFRDYLFVVDRPAFGEQRVKTEAVCGDDGHGMGRQAIAIAPYVKGYNIAPWIAAASPGNVGALLGELARLRGLAKQIASARSGILSGVACEHGWDTTVCPMRGCGPDEEALVEQLLAALAGAEEHGEADARR
ncbi:hypothetical protein HNP52_000309 [Sphingomonas kyeonggiensis]|uniref:Uncharacterized protein n=1 Tax=Sphingomonas kyeonggiensis TaxID=1268553 RepID=A0A7W7NPW6_9SPHN|nr:hypothetical protein [Sphingomonas kyeonggiensis]MBB4837258.1 hypothetical protein [Sphingomonas kyeonggiensis]